MKRFGKAFQSLSIALAVLALGSIASAGSIRISGHVPLLQMAHGQYLQQEDANKQISLTVVLNLRKQDELATLITRLYTPGDPLYGQYLTPEEFRAEFAPTQEDLAQIAQYLSQRNLQLVSSTSNTIKVVGAVQDIEKAFSVQMGRYQASDARVVYSTNVDPQVDESVAPKIAGILGLNTFSKFSAHRVKRQSLASQPSPIGTGPQGGLSPSDIGKAYDFNQVSSKGSGQTLALMELDGYTASDISGYTKEFKISSVPSLQNIMVDGYNGAAGDGADEVTLDIELMMAVAPGASKILVYEGENSDTGPVDVYAKIADDNLAKQVSTSWGSPEDQNTTAYLNSENTIFMQMAAQGQAIYAAAGDSGAYDDGSALSVDDPASQPYVVATGGTTLAINSDGSYKSESSWGLTVEGQQQGGGGGISGVWPIPSYQSGVADSTNKGSTSKRMVPDISVDANPETGYAIYVGGAWNVYGGTSCAAPIWAAFTALINSQRASQGLPVIGFPDTAIYSLAKGSQYATLFNDVKDKSTNLYYPAVTGYDLSTGWGSMKAPSLLSALASYATGN